MGHARPFNNPLRRKKGKEKMTRQQNSAKRVDWKELIAGQEDFLRPLVETVVQQVLEAEMDETVGAGKGERTANRQGYRRAITVEL